MRKRINVRKKEKNLKIGVPDRSDEGGTILIFEQYAKHIVIAMPFTKFESTS